MRQQTYFIFLTALVGAIAIGTGSSFLSAQDKGKKKSMSTADKALYKGRTNPADILVLDGKKLFSTIQGSKGKSCMSCHASGKKSLRGVATHYPKIGSDGKLRSLQLMINYCLKNMGATTLFLKSGKTVAYVLYVKSLSNGMITNVKIDGKAKAWYKLGKKVFEQRRGERNMACYTCHNVLSGRTMHMQKLFRIGGRAAHWPTYSKTKKKTLLIEKRFLQCMGNARMKKLKMGSAPMVALELYVTSLGNKRAIIAVPGLVR